MSNKYCPIGIFDSGYGGLTILSKIKELMPEYDYLYLGDNARTPYGTRSFDVIYEYTKSAVEYLFSQGCKLVILACNTASAKALRTIQQKDLPLKYKNHRVLGVIRPTIECLDQYTKSGHIGLLGTLGTVKSESYILETQKLFPEYKITQKACPMWVPIIENQQIDTIGATYFIQKDLEDLLQKDPQIDAIVLGCTHYPLAIHKIKKLIPSYIKILNQGEIVAHSLKDYLKRHPEFFNNCSKNSSTIYLTTEVESTFNENASKFIREHVYAKHIHL